MLSSLTLKPRMSVEDLAAGMSGVLAGNCTQAVVCLVDRELVRVVEPACADAGAAYELTEQGRAWALRLISAAKAVESQVLECLGPDDAQVLKSLLNRLLSVIDPQAAALWGERK